MTIQAFDSILAAAHDHIFLFFTVVGKSFVGVVLSLNAILLYLRLNAPHIAVTSVVFTFLKNLGTIYYNGYAVNTVSWFVLIISSFQFKC
jgi:hypothetical protein